METSERTNNLMPQSPVANQLRFKPVSGQWPEVSLKMSLFHRCFSRILLKQIIDQVFYCKSGLRQESVKIVNLFCEAICEYFFVYMSLTQYDTAFFKLQNHRVVTSVLEQFWCPNLVKITPQPLFSPRLSAKRRHDL